MHIKIDSNSSDQRFDRFLRKWFKNYPDIKLSDIYTWIRTGFIKVNNKKAKEQYRLVDGDTIEINDKIELGNKRKTNTTDTKQKKFDNLDTLKIKKMILFEDDNRICLNKPATVVVHPWNAHYLDLSMNDYLEKLTSNYKAGSTFKPSFGFRLDKDTSGVLIAAKTYDAIQYINKIIRERQIDKFYLVIVIWEFPDYVKIDKPLEKQYNQKLDRWETVVNTRYGQKAITECWKQKIINHPTLWKLSLIKAQIHTGKMHQIRVHLASVWFPVLWDIVYGKPAINRILYKTTKVSRQLLHCREYSFFDMFSNKKLTLTAPIPDDFQKIIQIY